MDWFSNLCLAGLAIFAEIFSYLPKALQNDPKTAWQYRNQEYGFTLTLPDSNWIQIDNPDGVVAFKNQHHLMHAGVDAVSQSPEDYAKQCETFLQMLQNSPDILQTPVLIKDKTRSGNDLLYITTLTKGRTKDEQVYFAESYIYLADLQVSLLILFEGIIYMKSEMAKPMQIEFYKNSARDICLSLEVKQ